MGDLSHLDEALHAVVELPVDERIRRVRQPHWITYTRSQLIFEKLEDLLSYPRTDRMPNLLIVGNTNNGKTMIASRFQRLHPAADNANGDHAFVPVLLVQAPPVPDESRFYSAILEALGAPYKPRGPVVEKQVQVLHLLRGVHLRMLIIDEIHHILAGHIAKQGQPGPFREFCTLRLRLRDHFRMVRHTARIGPNPRAQAVSPRNPQG